MADDSELFDYELPRELVAQEPLRNRVDARLMVVDRAAAGDRAFPYSRPAGIAATPAIGWC